MGLSLNPPAPPLRRTSLSSTGGCMLLQMKLPASLLGPSHICLYGVWVGVAAAVCAAACACACAAICAPQAAAAAGVMVGPEAE